MSYIYPFLQVSVQWHWGTSDYDPFSFENNGPCHHILRENGFVLNPAMGDETGKQNSPFFSGACHNLAPIRRHLRSHHAPVTVPGRCASGVEVLTDRIQKVEAYPAAHGGFSDVWSCLLTHKQLPPKRVAVKAIRPVIANDEEFRAKKKAVKQELKVWAELRHRNVLPLYGITKGFGPFWAFVCPWAENGTLSEYLEKFDEQLGLKERLHLLGDVAIGLRYLHSHNVVHGDLSGSNVLITRKGRACLSDFGLSTLVDVSDAVITGVAYPGNIRWAAPELVENCAEGIPASQLQSQQADVYSFGSIMMQILTGKLPFHGIRRVAEIVIMISRGQKPHREKRWDGREIPEELWNFVRACWDVPSKRPSSDRIVIFIAEQLSKLLNEELERYILSGLGRT